MNTFSTNTTKTCTRVTGRHLATGSVVNSVSVTYFTINTIGTTSANDQLMAFTRHPKVAAALLVCPPFSYSISL